MMTSALLLLAAGVGIGVVAGILLAEGAGLRARRTVILASTAAVTLGLIAVLPSVAAVGPGDIEVTRPSPQAIQGLGGRNYAFSINFAADDSVWLSVHPSAQARALTSPKDIPAHAHEVVEVEVFRYEANSHCYTVVIGGKATEICPQH